MAKTSETFKIFVGNLNETVTGQDIRTLFEQYGPVVEADVVNVFGFVHMEHKDNGLEAIQNLNRQTFHGKEITVQEATCGHKNSSSRGLRGANYRGTNYRGSMTRGNGGGGVYREGSYREEYRDIGYGDGCYREDYRDIGYRDGSYRDNAYRDVAYREISYRDMGYRDHVFRDNNHRGGIVSIRGSMGSRRGFASRGRFSANANLNVKIFVGNLHDGAKSEDIRSLFEKYGKVAEADVVEATNYGFVHMVNVDEAQSAIKELNGHLLNERALVVEASVKSRLKKIKIFVGNVHKDAKPEELRELFEKYSTVLECDIVSNYAFIHMNDEILARKAIEELDGYMLHDQPIRVEESISKVRQVPGMGNSDNCYLCGSCDHWFKACPMGNPDYPPIGYATNNRRGHQVSRYSPYPPPPPSSMYPRDPWEHYLHHYQPPEDYHQYYQYEKRQRYYDDIITIKRRYKGIEQHNPPELDYLTTGRRSSSLHRYQPYSC